MKLARFLALCSCAVVGFSQPGTVKTPGLGFAWDARSHQIRPIHGFPGAALLGDGLAASGFSSAAISPRHDLAFAISDGKLQIIRLATGEAQDISGIAAVPSAIAFSPSGTAALAVASGLQLVTGLQSSIAVQDLGVFPDSGKVSNPAVSDDAQAILYSTDSATWLLTPGLSPIQLSVPGPIAAAAFRPGSRDVVLVGTDGAIYRLPNTDLPGEIQAILGADERTASAVAIQFSTDGTHAYTANRSGTVAAIDLAASSIAAVDCGCSPTTLDPLAATGLYRISEISDRPVMLFDVSTSTPRTWFVPADAPSADSKRSDQ